jgi:hypothetical protein
VVCAYYPVTEEERHLLETTARSLLRLNEEILNRVAASKLCNSPYPLDQED